MTWVKICGITNLEDALVAVDAGADALGFVFYDKSPRKVDVQTVREITSKLPDNVEKVGVFVGDTGQTLPAIEHAGLTGIQLHLSFERVGDQEKEYGSGLRRKQLRVFQALSMKAILDDQRVFKGLVRSFETFHRNGHYDGGPLKKQNGRTAKVQIPIGPFFFLDAGTPSQPGGTGKTFDWKAAAPLVNSMRKNVYVVIAGGLNPSNVTTAIDTLHPWGVDVSSGVEAKPGKKDPEKVRAFVQAVRTAEKRA
jgi:phosphoribosylanthranilate isomerase